MTPTLSLESRLRQVQGEEDACDGPIERDRYIRSAYERISRGSSVVTAVYDDVK